MCAVVWWCGGVRVDVVWCSEAWFSVVWRVCCDGGVVEMGLLLLVMLWWF